MAQANIQSLMDQQAQPKVTTASGGQVSVTDFMGDQVNNPSLPAGTKINPVNVQDGPGTNLSGNYGVDPNGAKADTKQTDGTATADAPEQKDAVTYDPTKVSEALEQMGGPQAAQGQVNPESTVQGQLAQLMDFDPNDPKQMPAWAKAAVYKANAAMAARGMGSSSMAGEAVVGQMMQSALPIAAQDAQSHLAMQFKNLDNQQQANLMEWQTKAQGLFTDSAAENAAKQFNAQNANQLTMFYDQMFTDVEKFNASQINAMEQFDVGQENAMEQFNTSLQDARERFNAQQQLVVDQSNVQWRRQINLANTAAANAANQANATNLLQLSNSALNNIWQQFRDEAAWAFTASENQKTRNHNIAMVAMEQEFLKEQYSKQRSDANKDNFWSGVGQFAADVITGIDW